MDTAQNLTGPSSLVFPGENASNFEQVARTEAEVQFGYNAIRVSFAPYCSVQYGLNTATSPQDFMGNYSEAQLVRAVTIAEYFSLWILVDYHGSADFANTTLTDCWLNFWFGPNTVSGPTGVVGRSCTSIRASSGSPSTSLIRQPSVSVPPAGARIILYSAS